MLTMDNNKKKDLTTKEGFITFTTSPSKVNLPDGKKFIQSVFTFETEDGQKAYFEARQKIIEQYQASNIKPDTKVRIGYVMLGNEKNNKCFNKLFINKLELAD